MTISDPFSTANATSSRIIIKNLPKSIDEKRLRQHFGAKGAITDVKLLHTPSGVFRRFAYIGYSSHFEAAAAISHFNRTFIDTTRIDVQPALSVGDPNLPRAWSRYSEGSSADAETQARLERESEGRRHSQAEKARTDIEKKRAFLASIYGDTDNNDAGLKKYLSANKPKSKTHTWENDDDIMNDNSGPSVRKKKKKAKAKVVSVPNKKPGGSGQLLAQTHITYGSSDEGNEDIPIDDAVGQGDSDEEYQDITDPSKNIEGDPESTVPEDVSESSAVDIDFTGQGGLGDEQARGPSKDEDQVKKLSPELINEIGRLFVRNLPFACTQDDLYRLFEQFGSVSEVHLSLSRETKRPKGFAYIQFVHPPNAFQAFRTLDGTIFQGRLLHILPAEAKLRPGTEPIASFKDQRMARLKGDAGREYNWASLFIRSDTVLEAIANGLGVSKAEIMDPSSSNLAIRLATAESHLIADTKKALEAEGVDLSVFEDNGIKTRSDRVIIVKNLPFDTERSELAKLFQKRGPLGRLIHPPTKAIALVEFLEANDAKSALRSLSYSKFHSVPLFLEWAPAGIFKSEYVVTEQRKDAEPVRVIADSVTLSLDDESQSDTVYVKNVSFDTTEATLTSIFSPVGPIKSVTIPRKCDPKRPSVGLLSLGFAFVQFENAELANLAIDRLQGVHVDGHSLVLKRANAANQANVSNKSTRKRKSTEQTEPPDGTTLLIRNVPFEANEREVKELLRNFATVKRVRLPKKFDGGHRGFAFAEFGSHADAKTASNSLAHTHLYGRHLVIEWAANTDSASMVESSRQKATKNAANIE